MKVLYRSSISQPFLYRATVWFNRSCNSGLQHVNAFFDHLPIDVSPQAFWLNVCKPLDCFRRHSVLSWQLIRIRLSDCPSLSCELTAQTLPSAHSTVGLPQMEWVAARAICDAASCRQDTDLHTTFFLPSVKTLTKETGLFFF